MYGTEAQYPQATAISGNRMADAQKAATALEEVRARLSNIQSSVLGIGQRLQTVADRASGPIPQPVQNANGGIKPPASAGLLGEVNDFLNNIERELQWAFTQTERVERIA